MAMDLLWSDPCPNDEMTGMHANVLRDPHKQSNIMMYGKDVVDKFLMQNQVSMIVRSHTNPQDAIDKHAGNQVITISSTANYGGNQGNDAASLHIQKKLCIAPKIFQPLHTGSQWQQIPLEQGTEHSCVRRALTPPRERQQ